MTRNESFTKLHDVNIRLFLRPISSLPNISPKIYGQKNLTCTQILAIQETAGSLIHYYLAFHYYFHYYSFIIEIFLTLQQYKFKLFSFLQVKLISMTVVNDNQCILVGGRKKDKREEGKKRRREGGREVEREGG